MDENIEKPRPAGPLVFQIGFGFCASTYLKRTFARNGFQALEWHKGLLANDIIYSKYSHQLPLQNWPNVTFFGGLENTHIPNKPPIEAFKEFAYLRACFPDALFIYDTRKIETWIEIKQGHNQGAHADIWARHLNVSINALPEIWRKDWQTHQQKVFEFFDEDNRFFHFDCDTRNVSDLKIFLEPWFSVPKTPKRMLLRSVNFFDPGFRRPTKKSSSRGFGQKFSDPDFIERVATHCIGNLCPGLETTKKPGLSSIYAEWDGKSSVIDRRGEKMPVIVTNDGYFHGKPGVENLHRVAQTLNEFQSIGRHAAIRMDMQDAREFGIEGVSDLSDPIIVYNRRPNSRNMVLWPLPGYHTLGLAQFAHKFPIDTLEFDDKSDIAAWRGSVSGRARKELAPELKKFRFSGPILNDLSESGDEKEIEALQAELLALLRYNFVSRNILSENIDAALTYDVRLFPLKDRPSFSGICSKRVPHSWFYKHKYILSLSGYDTGSNFFLAANSNSVVLKEEDNWELFYTSEFKAWEHYIPLEKNAFDVEEKLEWAKANPKLCREISAASRQVCAKFADKHAREIILKKTFDAVVNWKNY